MHATLAMSFGGQIALTEDVEPILHRTTDPDRGADLHVAILIWAFVPAATVAPFGRAGAIAA
ncbi:MAG: hypothetical protein JSU70_05555 [Phycisphaerales bacterium]|nr:MAG: hypothetical protein JSU70_05555 [Phycisphaerales bacterium]